MKHLRIFNALNDYKSATLYYPSVSYIKGEKSVIYDKTGLEDELKIGDYLLSDLKTKVKQADLTAEQKGQVVGIFIGKNPINGKDVFINLKAIKGDYGNKMFYNPEDKVYKFDPTKFKIYTPTEYHTSFDKWGSDNPKNNIDMIDGMPGYITGTFPITTTNPDRNNEIVFINDFAGKQNTIEWYKQAVAAGIDVENEMPALWSLIHDVNGLDSLTDDFDGWFLGSMGHAYLIGSRNSTDINQRYAQDINASYKNITGEDPAGYNHWTSSFCRQDSDYSGLYGLDLGSGACYVSYSYVGSDHRLFAVIER